MPDNMVCADDLRRTRPTPLAMYRCFIELDVWPARTVVKVDDTAPGIAEGRNAGCWSVGVAVSGNGVGLTPAEWSALRPRDQQALRAAATAQLIDAGADVVIDSVAGLMPVLDEIDRKLRAGQVPTVPA